MNFVCTSINNNKIGKMIQHLMTFIYFIYVYYYLLLVLFIVLLKQSKTELRNFVLKSGEYIK